MNITKHTEYKMETMTQEQMLDIYIGKKGTAEREEFDAQVIAEAQVYFIGEAIRKARKQQGLTQAELGERMGVQRAQVSKLENGKGIAYSTLVRAFRALGAETASLDLGKLGRVALW